MRIAPEDITEQTSVATGAHVREVDVDGVALLVDEEAGRAHALNGTGTAVWRLLPQFSDVGSLVDDLAEAFSAERATVADGVLSLLQNLGALGFLEEVARSLDSIPIDIEMVPPDDECDDALATRSGAPDFDDRYLATPPNY